MTKIEQMNYNFLIRIHSFYFFSESICIKRGTCLFIQIKCLYIFFMKQTFILKRKFTLSSLQNYLFQSYSRFSRTKGNSRKWSITKVQNKLGLEKKKSQIIVSIIKFYALIIAKIILIKAKID